MEPTLKIFDTKNCLTLWLNTIESWEGFEQIACFIEINCGGKVIDKTDGPDSRIWLIEINNSIINLKHDDLMGNCICSTNQNENWIVEQIEKKILKALKENN